MAEKLMRYYDDARKLGGLKAQMRLAILTNIPGPKAQQLPDSTENISIFERAMNEIKKEFKN